MKILHVISSIGGGGRERRMGQLVIDISKGKFAEQHILCFKKDNNEYQEIINSGAIIHRIDSDGRLDTIWKIYSVLKSLSPDLVHLWTEIPIVLFASIIFKLNFHFKLVVGFLADGNVVKSMSTRVIINLSYHICEAIVSNSYAGLKAKKAIMKKSHVIYNGFDSKRIPKDCISKADICSSLQISDSFLVSMAARFSKAKDWDMFLNVAEKIQNIRNDVYFLAIGSGQLLDFYKNECKNKSIKNVVFLGQRSDVMEMYTVSDISLLFTNNEVHAEGVSNTIMESMAVGCPIIATEGGGTPEIIKNGINGFIIKPKDSDKACELILGLLDNKTLYKEISRNEINTINTDFVLSDKTKEYINLYNSILS